MTCWGRCVAVVWLGVLGCAEAAPAEVSHKSLALEPSDSAREWGPPVTVDHDELGSAFSPAIAAIGGGVAVAAWYQYDGPRPGDPEDHYNVWSSQWLAGPAWGAPTPIQRGHWSWDDLYMTGTRHGTAVLGLHEPSEKFTEARISAMAFDGRRWGAPTLLLNRIHDRGGPMRTVFVGARSGQTFLQQTDGRGSFGVAVMSEHFDGAEWRRRPFLGEWMWMWHEAADVAIDDAGHVLAAWGETQEDPWSEDPSPPPTVVQVSELGPADERWAEPVVLDAFVGATYYYSSHAAVALSPDGQRGLATWQGLQTLRFSRYEPSAGWSRAREVPFDSAIDELEVDAAGNALTLGVRDGALFAARYDWAIDAWRDLGIIAAATSDDMDRLPPLAELSFASEPGGNAVAAWTQCDVGKYRAAWVAHYTPSGGWDSPSALDPTARYEAGSPRVAIDEEGSAFAIWQQRTGKRVDIRARRYD
ncbi:MAG: hypothetical protein ABW321_29585 [Polyangiales bacterium]